MGNNEEKKVGVAGFEPYTENYKPNFIP